MALATWAEHDTRTNARRARAWARRRLDRRIADMRRLLAAMAASSTAAALARPPRRLSRRAARASASGPSPSVTRRITRRDGFRDWRCRSASSRRWKAFQLKGSEAR